MRASRRTFFSNVLIKPSIASDQSIERHAQFRIGAGFALPCDAVRVRRIGTLLATTFCTLPCNQLRMREHLFLSHCEHVERMPAHRPN